MWTTETTINGLSIEKFALSNILRLRENRYNLQTLVLSEDAIKYHYGAMIKEGDQTITTIRRTDQTDTTTIFSGTIRRTQPTFNEGVETLRIEIDGVGSALEMPVGEEYGSESTHPTLDTIKEMIEDATNGVVPKWVNKVLGGALDSGHSLTTQVETVTGEIKYVYFPYKPANKALNDLCDIVQGIKGAAAGVHWRVDGSGRLLLATVGNHGSPASSYWGTWWRGECSDSTLTVQENILSSRLFTLTPEANYILYHGKLRKPVTEIWTEGSATDWSATVGSLTISDDGTDYKVGSYSIKGSTTESGGANRMLYPSGGTGLGLDITKMGGKYNIPVMSFFAKKNVEVTSFRVWLDFAAPAGSAYRDLVLSDDMWAGFDLSVGEYQSSPSNEAGWLYSGTPDWSNVDAIWFQMAYAANSNDKYVWVDGLQFNGSVLRAARQTAAYTTADPCKIRVITDDTAKDDSLVASDDSGLMARLAYAEYLRLSSTPTVGTINIPQTLDLYPGQLFYLKAAARDGGTYKIDATFRAPQVIHDLINKTSNVDVTSDILNSNPRPVPNQYNTMLNAVLPENQNRQSSSIKSREIDITQPILEKSY